jgi:hypothetical protein
MQDGADRKRYTADHVKHHWEFVLSNHVGPALTTDYLSGEAGGEGGLWKDISGRESRRYGQPA